jgi:hypothetical protein
MAPRLVSLPRKSGQNLLQQGAAAECCQRNLVQALALALIQMLELLPGSNQKLMVEQALALIRMLERAQMSIRILEQPLELIQTQAVGQLMELHQTMGLAPTRMRGLVSSPGLPHTKNQA